MAFVVNEPQDTTKIRNLGTVIRPNWLAIQDGESTFKPKAINLPNRTPLSEPNDPVTIADTNILYSKDDSRAVVVPELYNMSAGGIVYQLTTSLDAQTLLFGANPGWTFLPGGLIMQYGTFTPGNGNATGTLTFNFDFPTAVFNVQVQLEQDTASTNRIPAIHTYAVGGVSYRAGGADAATKYNWVAIGN